MSVAIVLCVPQLPPPDRWEELGTCLHFACCDGTVASCVSHVV